MRSLVALAVVRRLRRILRASAGQAQAAARVAPGQERQAGRFEARAARRQDDRDAGGRDSDRQAQAAARLQGRGVGDAACPAGAPWPLSDDGKKVYVGTRVIGRVYEVTDDGGKRTRARGGRQADPARRRGDEQGRAVRLRHRQGAALRQHRVQPERAAGRHDRPSSTCRRSSTTTGSTSPSVPTASCTCRSARRATSASRRRKEYAQIRRYNADGSGKEVIATGVRNSVGFDWHPKTKELWFTDHGRDWAGDKGFEDELNRISQGRRQLRLPVLPRQRHARPGREEGRRPARA